MEKINISRELREDIINTRKELGITSYDLSEKSGNSKHWLPNIEVGKTRKITMENLISIYRILLEGKTDEEILSYIKEVTTNTYEENCSTLSEMLKEYDEVSRKITDAIESINILLDDTGIELKSKDALIKELNQKKEDIKVKMHKYIDAL